MSHWIFKVQLKDLIKKYEADELSLYDVCKAMRERLEDLSSELDFGLHNIITKTEIDGIHEILDQILDELSEYETEPEYLLEENINDMFDEIYDLGDLRVRGIDNLCWID